MSFGVRHSSGVCRLHDATVPEAAVAFEETFALNAIAAAGFRVRNRRRGAWATGRKNDQDVLTLVSEPEPGTSEVEFLNSQFLEFPMSYFLTSLLPQLPL